MLKDKLGIVQNFILTDDLKLKHLNSDLGLKSTAKILGDCNWQVNYKTDLYLDEIHTLYNKHLSNCTIYNNIQDDEFRWAETTLALVMELKTPYVFYLTEDRMFHRTNKEEFSEIINDMMESNISWMSISKMWKYGASIHPPISKQQNLPPYMDNHKHFYTYLSKNSPYYVLSVDSIWERNILIDSLGRLCGKEHPQFQKPHMMEHYTNNWLPNVWPDLLCAVPKKQIIVSDDDPQMEKIGESGQFK
jgi:hypothetical protein